uniref:Uncharacterized protein n=1 Tax=Oryza punctata TaxID=4537 RepID=A0A0E0MB06_ORYPU
MRKQSSSTSCAAAVVLFCKVLLMVMGLICALHTAPVEGGRAAAAVGGSGVNLPPSYSRRCASPYRCPPASSP